MARFESIEVRSLTRTDANSAMAVGIGITQRDAYASRFKGFRLQNIEDRFAANPFNPAHIAETLYNLRQGPENGWHWAAALDHHMGYTAVLGFALCVADNEGAHLAELHTHPEAQRRGLARMMARKVLADTLVYHNLGPNTPVTLDVARQFPNDTNEHPYAFYRSLTFRQIDDGTPLEIGGVSLPTQVLGTTAGEVMQALSR